MLVVYEHVGFPEDPPTAFRDWFFIDTNAILDTSSNMLRPNDIPIMKPGHFGIYDPTQHRTKVSEDERQTEDLIVLMEILPEFAKLSFAKVDLPLKDGLTIGLCEMMNANSIEGLPMYAVFAAHIFLDIHHILRRDVIRPLAHFKVSAK